MRLRDPGTGGDEFATNVCVVNESQEFSHGEDPKLNSGRIEIPRRRKPLT